MVLTQGLYQPEALRGWQRRPTPLNGVSMADAGFRGIQMCQGELRGPGTADGAHARYGSTSWRR